MNSKAQSYISDRKREVYEKNAKIIKYYRRNPIIACEDILGIKLMDSQKLILQKCWNTKYNVWACTRNFGKSFLLVVFAMLKMLLYPNQSIYLVSSKGNQAIETYLKLEDIAKQRIESIPSLKDIFINEVESSSNSDGFIHDKGSHKVVLLNHSGLFTLNSVPDNVRGKRASAALIDEAAFTDEELINVIIPFISQKSDFKLSVEDGFDQELLKKLVPNQLIFSSSASEVDHKFAKMYKEYAIKMLAGDPNYAVFDIPCDVPLAPMVDGKSAPPLLEQGEIDDMMKTNPDKALREYFNKFQKEGGAEQMVKLSQVRKAETFILPKLFSNDKDEKFVIAMDSALQNDNSIIMVMQILHSEDRGYYGRIVNCINLVDTAKKNNIQLKSQAQMDRLKDVILAYNGDSKDYKQIDRLMVDAGHAGMLVFLDLMLSDWTDEKGLKHKGFIDSTHPRYEGEKRNYPNAWDKVDAISPQKYRKEMCEEFFELMREGLIEFPQEYDHKGYVFEENGDSLSRRELSSEEELALVNIDILKTETTSIHRSGTRDSPKYELPKNKIRKMHDDRFYCLILLARHLSKIRRDEEMSKNRTSKKFNFSNAKSCATKISF